MHTIKGSEGIKRHVFSNICGFYYSSNFNLYVLQEYPDFTSGYVPEADFCKGKKVLVAAVFLGKEQELAAAETRWLQGECH